MTEDILEVRLDRPYDALEKLEGSGLVREAALFGDTLHAVVADAREARPAVAAFLHDEGFTVTSAAAVTPSLEDVFVSLIEAEDRKAAAEKAT
jgi:ABC-2 type transport system ATP-binding protein